MNRKGEKNPNAKLTEEDISFIRENYIEGDRDLGQRGLAKKFNISPGTIWKILKYQIWKK